MSSRSSLSVVQRVSAVACFERGLGYRTTARFLGAPAVAVRSLYGLWRIHGRGVLVSRAPKSYSFEVKLALVQRFLAGETGQDLAVEAGLSSRQQLQKWVRDYRLEGEDGLRPKRNGRPAKSETAASREPGVVPSAKSAAGPRAGEASELEQLRRENELLRAQVAYLGKLRALRAQEQR